MSLFFALVGGAKRDTDRLAIERAVGPTQYDDYDIGEWSVHLDHLHIWLTGQHESFDLTKNVRIHF